MHICYAFTKRATIRKGESMRLDLIIIAIGILLAVAMVLTLLFGKEFSRHGYGRVTPFEHKPLIEVVNFHPVGLLRPGYGPPCRIG